MGYMCSAEPAGTTHRFARSRADVRVVLCDEADGLAEARCLKVS